MAQVTDRLGPHNIALCGPNTLGFIALDGGAALWSSPLPSHLEVGTIGAVFSSSGLLNLFFNSAADRCLGFRYAIAPGNQVGVGFTDYFRWLIEDPDTRVIVTVIESMTRPDEVCCRLSLPRMPNDRLKELYRNSVAVAAKTGKKLFFLSRASELLDRSWFQFFAELKVPFLLEYEKSLRAVRNILNLSRREFVSDRITETPVSPEVVSSFRAQLASNGNRPPDRALVRQLLTAYGIRMAPEHLASSQEDAMEAAAGMGFPVALKFQSADLPHKTEVGGVLLHLGSEQEVASGYGQLLARVARAAPDATIEGILVKKMVDGVAEVIVGVSPTKDLGMCVVFGLGGIYTEVLKDVVFRLPPLSIADATDMIGEIKAYPVLTGARGRPSGDLRALAETIVAISRLARDFRANVEEIEFNPLLVLPEGGGVVAVDTLLQVKPT